MEVLKTKKDLDSFFSDKKRILIPTMGSLHAGHLSLIDLAHQYNQKQHLEYKIIVSIFVNPLQFESTETFNSYPRNLEQDCSKLVSNGLADGVFYPSLDLIYPQPQKFFVKPTKWDDILEGAFRDNHFLGMCTVVLKLLNIVKPHTVVFGQKDYQQFLLIKHMLIDLNLDITTLMGKTIRNEYGLALSSRNIWLTDKQKIIASQLYVGLNAIKKSIINKSFDSKKTLAELSESLIHKGFDKVDYICVCDQMDLEKEYVKNQKRIAILGAALINKTRLIDNILIDL